MNARTMFVMLKNLRKIQSLEYIDQCQIAAIPKCNTDYFKSLVKMYQKRVFDDKTKGTGGPVYESDSVDAQNAVIGFMSVLKRARGIN